MTAGMKRNPALRIKRGCPIAAAMRWLFLLPFLGVLAATAIMAAESAEMAGARSLFEAGRFPEARLAFEKLLASDSSNADIHYYLGELALKGGDADAAVVELQRAEVLAPGCARIHGALGQAFGRSAEKAGVFSKYGLARKCVAEFERAAALDPGNVGFHESLLEYYSQAPAIVGGGPDRAAKEAAIIMKLNPVQGHRAYATLYIARGDYDRALAELDEVLRTEPKDYDALYKVGDVAAASGRHLDRGLASLRLCLGLAPPQGAPSHSAVQWRLGNILEEKGDPAGARAAYRAAVQLDPRFEPALDALKKLR
jgi:tetratricopeptide (TPR) repeat protein